MTTSGHAGESPVIMTDAVAGGGRLGESTVIMTYAATRPRG